MRGYIILFTIFSLFLVGPLLSFSPKLEVDLTRAYDGLETASVEVKNLSLHQCAVQVAVKSETGEYIGLWLSQPLPLHPSPPQCGLQAQAVIAGKSDLLLVRVESAGLVKTGLEGYLFLLQLKATGLRELWQTIGTVPMPKAPGFQRAELVFRPNFIQLDFGEDFADIPDLDHQRYFAYRWNKKNDKFEKTMPVRNFDKTNESVEEGEVFDVSNARQFLEAIGSNRTIRLAPGDYQLTKHSNITNAFLHWGDEFDGTEARISEVHNLTIIGTGEEPSRILVQPTYSTVLTFLKSSNINLTNLELGHYPDKGYCSGNVLEFEDCETIELRGVTLFGCGTEGLTLRKVNNLNMERSVIKECTYGILTMYESAEVKFQNCQFINCEEYNLINLTDCKDVSFFSLLISDNRAPGSSLFNIRRCEDLSFEGLSLSNNRVKRICNDKTYRDQIE